MAVKEETLRRETTLELDKDTIAAIIDGVAVKLQKDLALKGDEPSALVVGPSKRAGK